MTVATVLKLERGGAYRAEHVLALKRGLDRHLSGYEFAVLTDVDPLTLAYADIQRAASRTIRVSDPWPGWFAKVGLFRRGLFDGPVLYLDLDTVVVGDLAELAAYDGVPALLGDFKDPTRVASGVMAWTGDALAELYDEFQEHAAKIMAPQGGMNPPRLDWWLNQRLAGAPRIQTLFPGQVVSYKLDCREAGAAPAGARLVAFHGSPAPWELPFDHPLRQEWER